MYSKTLFSCSYLASDLWLENHRDYKRGNLKHPLYVLLFLISRKGSFICSIPQTGLHITQPLLNHLGALAGTSKSGNNLMTYYTMSRRSTTELCPIPPIPSKKLEKIKARRQEMFYTIKHLSNFIYNYNVSDI